MTMTLKPLEPIDDDASMKIGEELHKFAGGGSQSSDTADKVRKKCVRGNSDAACLISFCNEVELDHKVIVVPEVGMINAVVADLETQPADADYELLEPYVIHAARFLRKEASQSGQPLEEVVNRFADKSNTPKEFFYMRLGEYCINQCK